MSTVQQSLVIQAIQAQDGTPVALGDLIIYAAGPREIVRFKPDGTIEMGEGYTPTEAAEAFVCALRDRLPSEVELRALRAALKEKERAT